MICTTFCFSEFVLKMFINNGIHKIINCLLWCLKLHKNVLNNTNSEVKIYSKTVINNNDHFTPRKGSFTLCRKSVARPGGDLDLLHSLKRTLLNYSQVNYSTWIRFTGNLRERDDCDSTKIFGGNVAKNFCSFLNRDLAPNRDLIRERLTSTSFCWSSRSRHQIMFCSSVVVAGDDDGVAVTVIVAHAAAVVVANCEDAIVTDNLLYFSF